MDKLYSDLCQLRKKRKNGHYLKQKKNGMSTRQKSLASSALAPINNKVKLNIHELNFRFLM